MRKRKILEIADDGGYLTTMDDKIWIGTTIYAIDCENAGRYMNWDTDVDDDVFNGYAEEAFRGRNTPPRYAKKERSQN